jgi:hypothetical protein
MKVLNFVRPENGLIHDPLYNLGFENYEEQAIDCYLFMADFYSSLSSEKYTDKPKIVLTLEEPNFCTGGEDGEHFRIDRYADKVLTLCPYMAKTFSNRRHVFFPFNEKLIPSDQEKIWDIIYTGSIPHRIPWNKYLEIMRTYNYREAHYNRGTNPRCTYKEKINLYAQSKIALTHCLCCTDQAHIYRVYPKANEIEAFSHLDQGIMPQIKSRLFEAAFSKCLILCWKDPWRVIEKFFEPNKDFLYFINENDLKEKIDHVLNHYNEFTSIIESAYNKAINNYTTKHFVEKFIGLKQ